MPASAAAPLRRLTPASAAPWIAEIGSVSHSSGSIAGPGGLIPARVREEMGVEVARAMGCSLISWVHESNVEALGDIDDDPRCHPMVAHARASAENGRPVDATALLGHLPRPVADAARLHTARLALTAMAGASIESVLAGLGDRRPAAVPDRVVDAALAALATPVVVPALLGGFVSRAALRVAPPLPVPELTDPEPNLVATMVADAAPAYLATATARTVLLGLPVVVPLAVRVGNVAATVQVGRGKVVVRNGVLPNVWAIIDGDSETLLSQSVGDVVRRVSRLEALPR